MRRRGLLLALSMALAPTTVSSVGHAQGSDPAPAAPPPSAVIPAQAITPVHADYPALAKGDAVVTLALTILADGSVRSAKVIDGVEPFASAAVAASTGWRFAPARRGDKPIAVVMRAEIKFTAPLPVEAPPPAQAVTPSTDAVAPVTTAPPAPKAIEVTVFGVQLAPGGESISRAEVRLLPGAFGDPFRAIDMLPGVTPLASGIPYFYVRGAPPGNLGYFLDGIRVPLLYHVGLGPSVVNPAMVDRVDLYAGGYPAQYGRYAGGIVAGETKPPGTEWHGEGTIRVVDAGAMLEGPFADGKGSAMIGGRYSYTGLLLSLISPNTSLQYADYQARVAYRPSPHDELTLFAFGSYDYLGTKNPNATLFDTTFHRIDLRYDRRLGDGPDDKLREAITFGYDQTGFTGGSFVSDHILGSRTELTKRLGDHALFRAGLDAQLDGYEANLTSAFSKDKSFTSLFSNRLDLAVGARAEAVIELGPRFELTPGVRVDVFTSQGTVAPTVDPRLAARLAINKSLRLIDAAGVASQPPSFILPGPGFQPSLSGGLQRSVQVASGVEADLPLDITATLTGFHNAFFNMTDALGTTSVPTNRNNFTSTFERRSLGSATGLEVLVRRRLTKKLGGFLSYTLSRSERYLGNQSGPSAFDRTHVLNAASSYDFGHGYRAGARVMFYTGVPLVALDADSGRTPPFFRLDLRFEKRWELKNRWWISFVAEILNATLSKETLAQSCVSGNCSNVTIGPVTIPSLGVEAGF